ncbi:MULTISPECIES: hypothetical protein [Streptomyces]|nr:hypothetical protein [Streptomyces sp. NHF165]
MRRISWGALPLALCLTLAPGVAMAAGDKETPPPPGLGQSNWKSEGSGGGEKQSVGAKATRARTVVVEGDKGNNGSLKPRNTSWEAPACWYEPRTSPKELKALMNKYEPDKPKKKKETNPLDPADHDEIARKIQGQAQGFVGEYYQVDKYKNYNLDKQGKGMFWEGVPNPNKKNDPKANDCMKHAIWVDKGKTPDIPNAISPKVLAEYAYDELPIPDTDVEISPKDKQTVNLKTWIWLDKAKFKPVTVRAELPGTGLWAETKAEPYALTLEPGTTDAQTYPASGKCVIEHGSIGEPYTKGNSNQTPPCGLTYHRATQGGGSFPLKATLTWKVSWKGTDGAGDDLPEGSYDETRNITVREVQSIVR